MLLSCLLLRYICTNGLCNRCLSCVDLTDDMIDYIHIGIITSFKCMQGVFWRFTHLTSCRLWRGIARSVEPLRVGY